VLKKKSGVGRKVGASSCNHDGKVNILVPRRNTLGTSLGLRAGDPVCEALDSQIHRQLLAGLCNIW
jgi:hypothetical protein